MARLSSQGPWCWTYRRTPDGGNARGLAIASAVVIRAVSRSCYGVRPQTLDRREPLRRCANRLDTHRGQLGPSLRSSQKNGVRVVELKARVDTSNSDRSATLRDRALEFGACGLSSPRSLKVAEELQVRVGEGFAAEGISPELPDTFPSGPSGFALPSDRSARDAMVISILAQ